jgi:hypothetical protein
MKPSSLVASLLALSTAAAACSSDSKPRDDAGTPGDGGIEVPLDPTDGASGDGAAPDGTAADGPAPRMLSGRFANLNPDLGAFDVCERSLVNGTVVVTPQPLLAAIAGLEDGVPVDRVTRRFTIPFYDRASGRPNELFLVKPDTTDCTAPTGLLATDRVFAHFAQMDGERNTFAAFQLSFNTLVRERATCPTATACVHFWNYMTDATGAVAGPKLTAELVEGATRTVVLDEIAPGEDGPSVAPFVFDRTTGTTEIPWSAATPLRLSVREATAATPFVDVEIANAAGGNFSLFVTGKQGATGAAAPRAILCRDSDPDSGAFSACTRAAP